MAKMNHYFSVMRFIKSLDVDEIYRKLSEKKFENAYASGVYLFFVIAMASAEKGVEDSFYILISELTGKSIDEITGMEETEIYEAVNEAVGVDKVLKIFRKFFIED